ncbi:MAG: metallophosphoesterase [Pseudomonadota bacterium]
MSRPTLPSVFRAQPPSHPRGRTLRRTGLAAILLTAILGTISVIAFDNARAVPIVRRTSIGMSTLGPGTTSIRVALLSDIHLGNSGMRPSRLERIIDQVNAEHPDLVLLAGDFIAGHDASATQQAPGLSAPLARLKAPLGVIAVLGNHDYWTAPNAVRAALEDGGVTVLENEATRRGALTIVGVGDRFSGHDDLPHAFAAAQPLGGAPIVLTHSPDLVPDLPATLQVVLAGHTHCGQAVLPWMGPLVQVAPLAHWRQLYNPHYRCGRIQDPGRLTIVTAGVGSGTIPLRLGAMPDWWLLTLQPLNVVTAAGK